MVFILSYVVTRSVVGSMCGARHGKGGQGWSTEVMGVTSICESEVTRGFELHLSTLQLQSATKRVHFPNQN